MTEKEFTDKSITLSFEFDRYLVNHPEIAEKIPKGAAIFFEVEEDPEFTKKEMELVKRLKKNNEKFVTIKVQKVLPPFESRLVNPQLRLAANM